MSGKKAMVCCIMFIFLMLSPVAASYINEVPHHTPMPGGNQAVIQNVTPPDISWQKKDMNESFIASSVSQTSDGGYISAGYSGISPAFDYWIVKLTSTGDMTWQKSLGGSEEDTARSIMQTCDGGYIVAGESASTDRDVSGNHGDSDYWVVKLNSTGDITWQKCLGGKGGDAAYSIGQTNDGGYIVAGETWSTEGDVSGNHGYDDYWVVKLNSTGDITWQKCLGGSEEDTARSIMQTNDGGYIVAGDSGSTDGDVSGNHVNLSKRYDDGDYWVVKLSATGDITWQKCLGGSRKDTARSIMQTNDGGYIVTGDSGSTDGDVSGNHGYDDYWVVKLNSAGGISWQKCLGGSRREYAGSIEQTSDGGYVVAGASESGDGDVTGNQRSHIPFADYGNWIVKLTSTGDIDWQKFIKGGWAYSINQTKDGGYIVAGAHKILKLETNQTSANIKAKEVVSPSIFQDIINLVKQTIQIFQR